METSSSEIPFNYPIELFFVLLKGKQDENIEEEFPIDLELFFFQNISFKKKTITNE
ncbi:hypothetical protein GM3708_3055 [Geminocystis sp. NIES-3708]|uniref:hypothetical protein n=1 Tax=Geminocystis sp. NIES-3708 TaxID=1615909 RepID=UPI0005FCBC41|nr:hypothetical protein [Geminocystis sp. NIES-3708]BAQ62649.1 hypothetical protein GM3708_3055 [Geminocystis sp. NIES-3708]